MESELWYSRKKIPKPRKLYFFWICSLDYFAVWLPWAAVTEGRGWWCKAQAPWTEIVNFSSAINGKKLIKNCMVLHECEWIMPTGWSLFMHPQTDILPCTDIVMPAHSVWDKRIIIWGGKWVRDELTQLEKSWISLNLLSR